jgi:hypothetical protein
MPPAARLPQVRLPSGASVRRLAPGRRRDAAPTTSGNTA